MKKIADYFPIKIYIERNNKFFANIEWFLYKHFGIKRDIPCGRTRKDKYLCCCQFLLDEEHCYYNEDHTEVFCKCCGKMRLMSNHPVDLKNLYNEEF